MKRVGGHCCGIYGDSWYLCQKAPLSGWAITVSFRWGDILVSYQFVGFTKTLPAHLSKEESLIKSFFGYPL